MPYFESYSEVEVQTEEFLEACRPKEIKEVIEWLKDEGHLSNLKTPIPEEKQSIIDEEWINTCEKLSEIRLQLSNDEYNTILNIIKKY